MRVERTGHLACRPATAWAGLQLSAVLRTSAAPYVLIQEHGDWPERLLDGPVSGNLWLFGFIPLGPWHARIARPLVHPETGHYVMTEAGRFPLAGTWSRTLSLEPSGDGQTLYRESMEIKAAVFTPVLVLLSSPLLSRRLARLRGQVKDWIAAGF